ncbi:hypothetical protein J3R74_004053 [Puniceicoccus vermicola]
MAIAISSAKGWEFLNSRRSLQKRLSPFLSNERGLRIRGMWERNGDSHFDWASVVILRVNSAENLNLASSSENEQFS